MQDDFFTLLYNYDNLRYELQQVPPEPQTPPRPHITRTEVNQELIRRYITNNGVDYFRRIFNNNDVVIRDAEDAIFLRYDRVLVTGLYVCDITQWGYSVEVVFNHHIGGPGPILSPIAKTRHCFHSRTHWVWHDLYNYTANDHWPRYHPREIVPVNFRGTTEYLSGETFATDLAYYMRKHLNRIITDAWFEDTILFVNLHRLERSRMPTGHFIESSIHYALTSTLSSVPDIDAFAILLDGRFETSFGFHDMRFRTVYLLGGEVTPTIITDPSYAQVIEHILHYAPDILTQAWGTEVTLSPPEEFVILPDNHILVRGQWTCYHTGMTITMDAIFHYSVGWDGWTVIRLMLYAPVGWWSESFTPWHAPDWQPRYHTMETVPVRFYDMCPNTFESWYVTEYLSGETFAEELAYFAYMHLDRIISDVWFTGRLMYINLHPSEQRRMAGGTTGETIRYSTLVDSLSSVPDIDAFIILINGHPGVYFGGHGFHFSDVYLIERGAQ